MEARAPAAQFLARLQLLLAVAQALAGGAPPMEAFVPAAGAAVRAAGTVAAALPEARGAASSSPPKVPPPPPPPAPTPCAPGRYASTQIFSSACTPCEPGRFWNAQEFVQRGRVLSCQHCPAGRYQPRRAQLHCEDRPLRSKQSNAVQAIVTLPGFGAIRPTEATAFESALADLTGANANSVKIDIVRPLRRARGGGSGKRVVAMTFTVHTASLAIARAVLKDMLRKGFGHQLEIALTSRGMVVQGSITVRKAHLIGIAVSGESSNARGGGQHGGGGRHDEIMAAEIAAAWVGIGVLVSLCINDLHQRRATRADKFAVTIPVPTRAAAASTGYGGTDAEESASLNPPAAAAAREESIRF
jgi:hypothetical protein